MAYAVASTWRYARSSQAAEPVFAHSYRTFVHEDKVEILAWTSK